MGRAAAIVPAAGVDAIALAGDRVTRVVWANVDEPRATRVALVPDLGSGDGAAEAASSPPEASSSSSRPASVSAGADPEGMMVALLSERMAANGGFGHPHLATGCPFCRRAAAAYR